MQTRTASRRKPGGSRGKPNLNVLRARITAGMSREDLADAAGISVKQVGLIERGVARRSRPATLVGIADALQRDVFELFPDRGRP
jgi:transcriptional regulator with XRE-family HTH domain